jgi:hypothetical protein
MPYLRSPDLLGVPTMRDQDSDKQGSQQYETRYDFNERECSVD